MGVVSSLEINHKPVDTAGKGKEVCVKIEPGGGGAPRCYGRHFDHQDLLVSKVSSPPPPPPPLSLVCLCESGSLSLLPRSPESLLML